MFSLNFYKEYVYVTTFKLQSATFTRRTEQCDRPIYTLFFVTYQPTRVTDF